MTDANFTWNVFFKGPEGYKEHIQATAEDGTTLASARESVLKTLKELGATPEVDFKGSRGSSAPYAAPRQQPDPMVQAAVATGVSKVCPVHNVPMGYKAAGYSRTKKDAAGNPKPFNASFRCPEQGCTQIEWMGN